MEEFMDTLEQAQVSAYELSKGYADVATGNTLCGLGWTISLDEGHNNTATATYEAEDGELITFQVDLEPTRDNQETATELLRDALYDLGCWGWGNWTQMTDC
jgi:hypothetical protein